MKHKILYVKIYADNAMTVENEAGDILKRGSNHAELVRWAKKRAARVDYDT